MKKRIVVLLVASLMLLTSFSGCSGGSSSADTTAAPNESKTNESETSTGPTTAEILGFEKEDNGGDTFMILTSSTSDYEFNVEAQTGDIVSDAVF
ncbi:MAG: hypothetical protein IJC15_09110, partial [Clostridia bacterium]|nr:hypothetical protein [Clostridia bacterium]